MKRTGNGWNQILKHLKEERPLTTFEVAKICGVVHSTISNWIDEGKLTAYKTLGGHRRIKREELLLFLKLYRIPVPELILKNKSKKTPNSFEDLSTPIKTPRNQTKGHGDSPSQKRILIIEDDVPVSEIIVETLKRRRPEFEIAQAADSFEAGKQIVTFSPNLIILDLISPGVDGFKVLENIRQDQNCSHAKIIAITSYNTPETQEKILHSGGANACISKPIDLNQLNVHVENLLYKTTGKK